LAAIGVLRELERSRIPIHAIAGLEMGALIAGLYAQSASANFVEWTIGKIDPKKLFPRPMFAKRESDFSAVSEVVRDGAKLPIQSSKIPFACSSLNLGTDRVILARSGTLSEVLEVCAKSPPVFPLAGAVAGGAGDVAIAAEWLRSVGAEKVVLINPIAQGTLLKGETQIAERLYWRSVRNQVQSESSLTDFVIGIHTRDYDIRDFEARKTYILFGQEAGRIAARKLVESFGFY
jgi:NTE family protein